MSAQPKRRSLKLMVCFQSSTLPTRLLLAQVPFYVDVIVVDEVHRLPIGRPWLTLAIALATRVVVGFYVSVEAPSSTSVALRLIQAVLPKKPWLKTRALACAWPVWDLPRTLHADNGPDITSAALRRGCDEYGIKLILRPIATPHQGGHIESLIGRPMGRVHLRP